MIVATRGVGAFVYHIYGPADSTCFRVLVLTPHPPPPYSDNPQSPAC